jgi:hypothetical protein
MATYRCIQSGNTVTFTLAHDIATMKGHGGYVLLDEPEVKESVEVEPAKRMGRPRKIVETVQE